jgi:uncharacterized protein DUF6891
MTLGLTPGLSREDFDDLHEFIRTHVAAGYATDDEIVADAVDVFAENGASPVAVLTAARAIADQAAAGHADEQTGWASVTDCDRLDAAFAELEALGILARQHFSCCGACGATEITGELDDAARAGRPARGFTFFHVQDTEHAVAGELLYLSFGAASRDHGASLAIAQEVVAALGRQGLSPAWNGKIAHRIGLPLTWQRRRR